MKYSQFHFFFLLKENFSYPSPKAGVALCWGCWGLKFWNFFNLHMTLDYLHMQSCMYNLHEEKGLRERKDMTTQFRVLKYSPFLICHYRMDHLTMSD